MHTVIPLQSHCVSTQMGGITVGYKANLSIQFKQDKVHRSDSPHCNPTQGSSETFCIFIAVFPPKWVESQWGKKF